MSGCPVTVLWDRLSAGAKLEILKVGARKERLR